MEDGVAVLTEGPEREGYWAVAQFDVAGLLHDAFSVRDGEVGEVTMILLESIRAFGIWLV